MVVPSKSKAEAPAQAAGYLYQLRYALLRALKRLSKDPTALIGVERLDDIAVESASGLVGLDQLKHTTGDLELNDSSVQVWRTIGNWSRLTKTKGLDLSRTELALLTNASVANGSALSKLSPEEDARDISSAMEELRKVATTSQNKKTEKDRHDFSALGEAHQLALVTAIRVVPDLPNLKGLGSEIEDVLYYACDSSSLSDFRAELEGWWLDRVSGDLSAGSPSLVRLTELDAQVSYAKNTRELFCISTLRSQISSRTISQSTFS